MLRGPLLPLLALALAAPAAADDSLRCDGGIVSVGDSKIDLLGKCGPPALQEPRQEERAVVQRDDGGAGWGRRVSFAVERWTYNFGPNRFVHFVTMEAGKIVSMARGGYGYALDPPPAAPPIPRARCDHAALRTGMSTFDVLALCGEPALREVRVETRLWAEGEGGVTIGVTAAIWTYDFGPRAFVRFLAFRDGTLPRIETAATAIRAEPGP